jgi:hypothetical protein
MMKGINFNIQNPVKRESPNRMDIACFVGFIDYRTDVPQVDTGRTDIDKWLYQQSWMHSSDGYLATYQRDSADELRDVPVPIESWQSFTQLFKWDERDYGQGMYGAGYLAAAVRSFFAQGGRKCYVVRVGSPPSVDLTFIQRSELIDLLVPGFPAQVSSRGDDRESWHGVGHILGLSDVTLLSLPDLPDLLRSERIELSIDPVPEPGQTEQFVACSEPAPVLPSDNRVTHLSAPTLNEEGYFKWAETIHQVATFISHHRRDVQLIISLPLPSQQLGEEIDDLFVFLHDKQLLAELNKSKRSIGSAFVQIGYPWLSTTGADWLPQRIEPCDGALAGLLASNAISKGAFRSITGKQQSDITDIFPRLSRQTMYRIYSKEDVKVEDVTAEDIKAPLQTSMIDRVSLFANSINGVVLVSDVTSSNAIAHRPANVNRTISMVLRAARQMGDDFVFDNNGEALWAEISQRLDNLLGTLFDLGALRGNTTADAFFVRCDRSTMSQQDLDTGRVIAQIQFEPAASIESINVTLSMQKNDQASLQLIGINRKMGDAA